MVTTVEIDEAELRIEMVNNAVAGAEVQAEIRHLPTGKVGRASSTSRITARADAMADLKRQLGLD